MTIFVSDKTSAEHVFEILEKFKYASGLQINIEKTEGIWLGRERYNSETPFGIRWPKVPVKALGIYFSYNTTDSNTLNFISEIEELIRQLHWWKARALSLVGKVLIIKTIGLSKLNYVANVLHVQDDVIQIVKL